MATHRVNGIRLAISSNWRVNYNLYLKDVFYVHLFNSLTFFPRSVMRVGRPTSKKKRIFYSRRSWNRYIYKRMSLFRGSRYRISSFYYPLRLWFISPNLFFRSAFVLKGLFPLFFKITSSVFFKPFLSFLKTYKKISFLKPVSDFPFFKSPQKKYKKINKFFKLNVRFTYLNKTSASFKLPYYKLILKIFKESRLRQKRLRLYRIFYFLTHRSRQRKKGFMAFRRKFRLGKRRRMRMKKVSGLRLRHYIFLFANKIRARLLKMRKQKKGLKKKVKIKKIKELKNEKKKKKT